MARKATLTAPSGQTGVSIRFVDADDVIVGTVNMSERTNALGRYDSDSEPPAVAGVFDAVILVGAVAWGIHEDVRIENVVDEIVKVRLASKPTESPQFGRQYRMLTQSGQEIFVTLTDEQYVAPQSGNNLL